MKGSLHESGFTMLETLLVVALIGVISAIAVPQVANSFAYFRISGDARNVSNAIAVTKMRAASTFSKARVYIDLNGNAFHVETWQKTGTPSWVSEGGTVALRGSDTFGWSVVGSAPPNAPTIGQAPACLDAALHAIGNTACIVFNSRGIPVDDSNGSPSSLGAAYLTDGSAVYGVTVLATGMIRLWRTAAQATPSWIQQ
jgi:prepilin-type N-terminal cleavage/methylation domain-containing protein